MRLIVHTQRHLMSDLAALVAAEHKARIAILLGNKGEAR
jgi:hypothetical protein